MSEPFVCDNSCMSFYTGHCTCPENPNASREPKFDLISSLRAQIAEMEQIIREQWWRNHGCGKMGYGDDGEMQCCVKDFKRTPFKELQEWVWATRMKNAGKQISLYEETKAERDAALDRMKKLEEALREIRDWTAGATSFTDRAAIHVKLSDLLGDKP